MRPVIAALANDFDVMDIAAAALAMFHGASETAAPEPAVAHAHAYPPGADEEVSGPTVVLFVGAGRSGGIRPGDLVGAIAGEAHINARQIGGIKIEPHHSLVEVPEALADRVIKALKGTKLRGQKVDVRRQNR